MAGKLPKWISEREVAKITGRAVQTLRNDRSNRRGIPYTKIGKRFVRYNLADVIEFMSDHTIRFEQQG